jgi:hypothetical protein
VDVRPGAYSVTFTSPRFTAYRQTVDVPANVTVAVDGEMKVGTVGETITVEDRSPQWTSPSADAQ